MGVVAVMRKSRLLNGFILGMQFPYSWSEKVDHVDKIDCKCYVCCCWAQNVIVHAGEARARTVWAGLAAPIVW